MSAYWHQRTSDASLPPGVGFWATVTSNGSPYATGPLSCLSVMLVYCGRTVGWIKMLLDTEVAQATLC